VTYRSLSRGNPALWSAAARRHFPATKISRAGVTPSFNPISNFDFSNFGSLPEDVFDLVKDRGVAVGRLVVNSDRVAKLLHQFALLAQNATEMMRASPSMKARSATNCSTKNRRIVRF